MKHFLVILGLTALVWLGLYLSETRVFTIEPRIEFEGFDSVAYAPVQADSVVALRVQSNGYAALIYSLSSASERKVRLAMPGQGLRRAVAVADVADQVVSQLGFGTNPQPLRDSLRLSLAARTARTYAVDLSPVRFRFAQRYGLYGQPRVEPDSITLYGPKPMLDAISHIAAVDTTIADLDSSGRIVVQLDPIWLRYPELRPSATEVGVELCVERYAEHTLRVPVVVEGVDTSLHLRLYPAEVEVHAWVAERDFEHLTNRLVRASISYADVLAGGQCTVSLTHFPDYVRPFAIEPEVVHCVVMR